jgi:hypothetical protein
VHSIENLCDTSAERPKNTSIIEYRNKKPDAWSPSSHIVISEFLAKRTISTTQEFSVKNPGMSTLVSATMRATRKHATEEKYWASAG